MWTPTARRQHSRAGLRYGSDLTDAEWRLLDSQIGFAVHARRWMVERFFAWTNRNRRLAKDVEATIASAEAFLYAAAVMLLLRRLLVDEQIRARV